MSTRPNTGQNAGSNVGRRWALSPIDSRSHLLARMGQDSSRAALIYQHASRQVDQTIADKLSALIEDATSNSCTPNDRDDDNEDGSAGVLVPAG